MQTTPLILLAATAAAGFFISSESSNASVQPDTAASSALVQDHGQEKGQEMDKEGKPSPIDAAMDTLKKGQRAIRKDMKDPKANKEALMESLSEMEGAAHSAIALVPPTMKKVPKDKQDAWLINYKQQMTTLLGNILAMEDATLRESAEDLEKAYDAISEAKKVGHQNFRD